MKDMVPDAFSKGLHMGMVNTLHDLAVSPPTAIDVSSKDPGVVNMSDLPPVPQEEHAMPG